MDNNKARSLTFFGIILMFLVLLVLCVTVFLPTYDELEQQKLEVSSLDNQIKVLQASLDKKQEKDKLPEQELQAALPLWDNVEELVISLRKIGQQSQAQISNASVTINDKNQIHLLMDEKDSIYPSIQEVKIQASVQGSYTQVRAWIDQLQKLPRLISVDSVRYSKSVGEATAAELAFTAYFDPSYKNLLENPILPEIAK